MYKLYLLCLVITVAFAKTSLWVGNGLYWSDYGGLAGKKIPRVIMRLVGEDGRFNDGFLSNYIWARDAKVPIVDAQAVLNDNIPANKFCDDLDYHLPISFSRFNGTIWLRLFNQKGLWSLKAQDRIPYIEAVVNSCQKYGYKVGIAVDTITWVALMGRQSAGSAALGKLPLWYSNWNGAANFDDYAYTGFGPWSAPTMKQYLDYEGLSYYED